MGSASVLYLAWANSTSPVFGDRNARSNVLLIRSDDDGQTWTAPIQVNPSSPSDVHHVLPALALDTDAADVHVSYYTQHADETVDVDLANSHDRGESFPPDRTTRLTSTSFAWPPTVNRLVPTSINSPTVNYDAILPPGYSLGNT
jgi:hypothetical protein